MAHIRQSRPHYVLGFQVNVFKTFQVVPSLLGSGPQRLHFRPLTTNITGPSNLTFQAPCGAGYRDAGGRGVAALGADPDASLEAPTERTWHIQDSHGQIMALALTFQARKISLFPPVSAQDIGTLVDEALQLWAQIQMKEVAAGIPGP